MYGKKGYSYLSSIIGKEVRVFKGGPEASHGKLVGARPDFFTLLSGKDEVIYYQTQHIKSVIENSQTNMISIVPETLLVADDFHKLLSNLVGQLIRINRGGPESRKGALLYVTEDYLALETHKDEVIYYSIEHIKSVSIKLEELGKVNIKDKKGKDKGKDKDKDKDKDKGKGEEGKAESKEESKEESQEEGKEESKEEGNNKGKEKGENKEKEKKHRHSNKSNFIQVDDLDELFDEMLYSFVTINRGGPEKVEGVLVNTDGSLLTLVIHHDVFRISKYHIKSISQKIKNDSNNEEQENKQQNSGVSSLALAKKQNRDKKKRRS
ncbi:hypothetical protein [Bacillus sp. Marseille-P3661]|uniref:hypothetical protein n=1 Tax=Bacillus sp. Marseille-P3661 TaxID=1936234 RepID=UPI0015E15EB1|nr:hypothetical protein [Bacillus sp. Marseille-P3661]